MEIKQIAIKDIFLDLENPRHDTYQSQEEVIEYLCQHEYVFALAQDIVTMGTNPLEIMAVIPNPDTEEGKATYIIAEGNRRLCALKLLEDPELAPSNDRKNFKAISRQWKAFNTVAAVVFDDRDSVAGWLERIHGGLQGGIGRKSWNAEQKTRFTGDAKNLMAQQLLDYAQKKNMLTAEERSNKISTVQRFITNPLFKDALGIDTSKNDELQRIRNEVDFDLILKKFIGDLKLGNINTRFNAPEIRQYSHELRAVDGISSETIPPHPLSTPDKKEKSEKSKPNTPSKPRYLENNKETEKALSNLGNYKLVSIYNSLHRLVVAEHCPLLTIGLWSFLDSLTALNGRNQSTDFQSFLSNTKLESLGLGNKEATKTLRECLRRLSENGNTTKHDKQAAAFNDLQLINDFQSIHPLIQALIMNATDSSNK
ncbi:MULTISPECIES: hypothetical protein [Neisseria]|uniref:hypothetical protein n=1 Tax=Neisseria TaxID=482 RepID=UPI00359F34A3